MIRTRLPMTVEDTQRETIRGEGKKQCGWSIPACWKPCTTPLLVLTIREGRTMTASIVATKHTIRSRENREMSLPIPLLMFIILLMINYWRVVLHAQRLRVDACAWRCVRKALRVRCVRARRSVSVAACDRPPQAGMFALLIITCSH